MKTRRDGAAPRSRHDLREALQENQFFISTTIFELDPRRGVRRRSTAALAHPVRGIVDPESFMPVLEETGMVAPGRVVGC